MKNVFSEYYPISKEVINDVWDKGIFCYDANVLLNLYRYSNETRNKIFENIEYFIGKTIMPYQACYEYHKNRRGVEDSLLSSYDEIIKIIEQAANALESGDLAKYRKHCALDIDRDIIKPIKSATTKIVNKIKDTKSNHSSFLNVSEIHEKISQLFDGKISDKFSEDELKRIYTEGKSRYDKKIPPGFADYDNKKNKGENSLYGDLIIWKHLIEISKSKNSDIIFVTDDRKKDWWDIHHGQTKGALPELYREFKELTSHNILIYSVEDYMKYAPEHSEIAVPKKVINEIEELRKVDERRKNYIDLVSYNDIIEKVNMKTKLLDISEKYKEILKSFNHQNPITDYSKSYQEISKAMDKFNYNTQYLELIKSISELDQSKVLQLQKKLGMINKHNAEDDE
ncbi:PIN domain-containing protein [Alistipes finegoldii]|uniref:PIN-like domain-containing protein n=1 Tax=Alistipes finegoldii TaxID=214856 RepID=UPI0026DA7A99|nr:PIN domain-containing protein [Alistipes finegoldii]